MFAGLKAEVCVKACGFRFAKRNAFVMAHVTKIPFASSHFVDFPALWNFDFKLLSVLKSEVFDLLTGESKIND